MMPRLLLSGMTLLALIVAQPGWSMEVVRLELRDGVFIPDVLRVPAGQKIKIELYNTGTSAAEFESITLHKEKALAPGASSFVVIAPLRPGKYVFFDDFHPGESEGTIVAR